MIAAPRFCYPVCLVIAWLAGAMESCHASAEGNAPARVDVGIYINKVNQISLKDGTVNVDFYIWFRWADKTLKPHETFEIVNGQITSRDGLNESVMGEEMYACVHARAILYKVWDISRFPLDSHEIAFEVESNESEAHKLVYVPDLQNSGLNQFATVAGWVLMPGDASVRTSRYATNYGDVSLPTGSESLYSQFVYRFTINRPGSALFIKLFAGLYIAVGIGFLSLLIRPVDDPRFGLGIGAMFASVASQYVLSSNLPDSHSLTMADNLHIISFVFIFMVLLESTVALDLWRKGHESMSQRLDRWSLAAMASSYILLSAVCVLRG